ncbi:MAG: hypothetical protein WAM30_18380 [Candidatus Dormiibacterota bacterium]
MRFRRLVTLAAAAGLAGILLAGCSGIPIPFLTKSASQLAIDASQQWTKAGAHEFQGSLTANQSPITVDVTVASRSGGAGTGSGEFEGNPFRFLAAGGKTYLKGQSFWQAYYNSDQSQQTAAKGFEQKWAVASSNDVGLALGDLGNLGTLAAQLGVAAHTVKKGSDTTIGGQQVAPLSQGSTTWWVTESDPVSIVKVKAAQAAGMTNLSVTASARSSVDAAAPASGQFVDPSDPSTLPAYYAVIDFTLSPSCAPSGCAVTATIQNNGGQPEGVSVVEMNLESATDSSVLGTCDAPIPAIATSQTGPASCTVTSAALAAYSNPVIKYGASIKTNPPYIT